MFIAFFLCNSFNRYLEFSEEKMGRKKIKKNQGKPFIRGDSRLNFGSPCVDFETEPRFCEPKSVFDNVVTQVGGIPLRPYNDTEATCPNNNSDSLHFSQNWVIDEQKLLNATNDALKSHGPRKHVPNLQKQRVNKIGFGVQMSFRCSYKNCKFQSKLYDLYKKTETGQPLPNLQVGVALAKTDLTPSTVETLATTLNIDPPNLKTLRKSYNTALECCESLSEAAMTDNRKEVTVTMRLRGEIEKGQKPDPDVVTDGQYSNRDYHYLTGKSDSVSVPVIEQETGKALIIGHTNLSHRDGSLPEEVHINSGETFASGINYEKAYNAEKYPLRFGTVGTDGDVKLIKAMEAARQSVGESRPLKRKSCSFHLESTAKRKCVRESLTKLTPVQIELLNTPQPSSLSLDLAPNICAACKKEFKSSKGLNIHKRSCKGERAEECKIKGLEPLFLSWEKKSDMKLTVVNKKKWRDGIRRWLMKRIKLELNLGLHAANPNNLKIQNDESIHEALALAGKTIVPCLSGNHDLCLVDARGCGGEASPPDYDMLPNKTHIGPIPPQTAVWLGSIVDVILSREALTSLVVNGRKGTTSHVESAHKEIRIPVPKGRVYRKNEAKLIKSGNENGFALLS